MKRHTQAETAALLGVSATAMMKYRKAGCPCAREGRHWYFEMPAVVAWLLERDRRRAGLREAQARLLKARADLMEMEVARRRAEAVDAAEAADHWAGMAARIGKRTLKVAAHGRELAGLPPAEAEARLKALVHEALADLCRDKQAGNPADPVHRVRWVHPV